MTETQIALIGALFGGAGLKIIGDLTGKWVNRGREQFDEATAIRKELREELDKVREELSELKAEVDEWKEKYYKLLQEYLDLNTKYKLVEAELTELKEASNGNHLE